MEVKLSLHALNSYSLVATELGMLLLRDNLTVTGTSLTCHLDQISDCLINV